MGQQYVLAQGRVVELVQGDIVLQETDAIANAANGGLLGGGGVDGAIHRAAGPELLDACRKVKLTLPGGRLATGAAVATPGFRLRARYVIHCVGPIYAQAGPRAPALLAGCYRSALDICRDLDIRSVAFPSISTGIYGYPLKEAAPVALREVRTVLESSSVPTLVRFVLFEEISFRAYQEAANLVLG